MSEESIESITTLDRTFSPTLINSFQLSHVKFGGYCLLNNNVSASRKVINLNFITYYPHD